jgi:hypothetical protein
MTKTIQAPSVGRLAAGACALLAALLWSTALHPLPVAAQEATDAGAASSQLEVSSDDVTALVAPVALYPDPVLELILQASVLPLQIVRADRYLDGYEKDPSLAPPADLDPSILGLMNFPRLIRSMSQYLEWTEDLGNAVLDQLDDVQLAIQDVRLSSYQAGVLASNDRQDVILQDGIVVVLPKDPQNIAIPQYDPQALIAAIEPPAEASQAAGAAPSGEQPTTEAAAAAPSEAAEPQAEEAAPPPSEPSTASAEAPYVEPAPGYAGEPAAAYAAPAYAYPPPPAYAGAPVVTSYTEPQTSSFWSGTATFLTGAAVGGLIGYGIGDDWFDDDDGDNDNNNGNGGRKVNIEDSTIVVGNDRYSADKNLERKRNELEKRRDRQEIALRPDPKATGANRERRRQELQRREPVGVAPASLEGRKTQREKREVRLPGSAGGTGVAGTQVRTAQAAAATPARTQAAAPKRPASAVAGTTKKTEVRKASSRGASSRAVQAKAAAPTPKAAAPARQKSAFAGGSAKSQGMFAGGKSDRNKVRASSNRGKQSRGGRNRRG